MAGIPDNMNDVDDLANIPIQQYVGSRDYEKSSQVWQANAFVLYASITYLVLMWLLVGQHTGGSSASWQHNVERSHYERHP